MAAGKQSRAAVVAADSGVRESFQFLLETHGYTTGTYDSGDKFLAEPLPALACIIVYHSKPEVNGLDIIEHIRNSGHATPTVLITDPLSTHEAEQASKLTALTVLEKPLTDEALLNYLCSLCPTQED